MENESTQTLQEISKKEYVRILSGINSIDFNKGYDPITKIFDIRKTEIPPSVAMCCGSNDGIEVRGIRCYKDANGTRPDLKLEDGITRELIKQATKNHEGRGKKYIMSGIVSADQIKGAIISSAIGYTLKVDKLLKYENKLWSSEKIVDVSDRL